MRLLNRNTELVKLVMDKVIKENDLCLDLTLGDGNDSLYMYNLKARVLAFDVQNESIESSKKLFLDNNIDVLNNDCITFIKDGHENLDKYLSDNEKDNKEIKFACFNLGYLPSGDKTIITKKDTTLTAIDKVLKYLSKDGVLSIIAYYDHEGGLEEKDAVDDYLKNINEDEYEVVKLDKYNNKKRVPITYFVYRR